MKRRSNQRGSTLIDICAACVMGSVTMALALPSYQNYLERTRRIDAVTALQRVQDAQAKHLATNGSYALRLDQLAGGELPELSDRGLYRITLFSDSPDSFEARASALPDRDQVKEPGCTQMTLRVTHGVIAYEPSARCWNP
jgi:type IV pilus assembly protein PilE